MFIVYMQKNKDDCAEFPLNKGINLLSKVFNNNCWIFSLPGYLSKGKNTEKFICSFNELINDSDNKQYIGFGNGYNSINSRKNTIDLIDYYEKTPDFRLRNYVVKLTNPPKNNHSKALFYFLWNNKQMMEKYEKREIALSKETFETFVDNISVKAVIIGSSNQSYNTFFKEFADKGETDVMLVLDGYENGDKKIGDIDFFRSISINSDYLGNYEDYSNLVVSKCINIPYGYKSFQEYLNCVFKKCLMNEFEIN